ncbi:MAG: hypothetical protein JXA82_16455 [Sedimentisphaerales bacterium]|nr:hypothetical protein [Sedimentisphaerales bacterium]
MILLLYLIVMLSVFAGIYLALPYLARCIVTKMESSISDRFGQKLSTDIRDYLGKARSGVLPDLKYQVISHLVEPWLGKLMDSLADVLAGSGGQKIAEKYGDIVVQVILAKRLLISLILSQFVALLVVLGWYLGKAV